MRGQALLLCKIFNDRNRLRRPNGRHRKKSASRKNLRLADFILSALITTPAVTPRAERRRVRCVGDTLAAPRSFRRRLR